METHERVKKVLGIKGETKPGDLMSKYASASEEKRSRLDYQLETMNMKKKMSKKESVKKVMKPMMKKVKAMAKSPKVAKTMKRAY